jgi:hypothetical protein
MVINSLKIFFVVISIIFIKNTFKIFNVSEQPKDLPIVLIHINANLFFPLIYYSFSLKPKVMYHSGQCGLSA